LNFSFKDLPFFTKVYYRETGLRFYAFLLIALLPAFLDGIGITMIVPLLALVNDTALEVDPAMNENFAFQLLTFLQIPIELAYILLFILCIYLVKFLIGAASGLVRAGLIANLSQQVRLKLFSSYLKMNYRYYLSGNTGYFINVINPQVNQFISGFAYITLFYAKLIAAVSYVLFSFFIDWKFSLLALLAGLLLSVLFKGFNAIVKSQSIKTATDEGVLSNLFIQSLQGFKYLKSTFSYKSLEGKVYSVTDKIKHQRLKAERVRAFFEASYEPITILLIVILVFVQIEILDKTLATMILSIYLFNRALSNFLVTQKEWQFVLNLSGGINSVVEELKKTHENQEQNGVIGLDVFQRSIIFDRVGFSYPEKTVIENFSLTINKNEMIAIVGASGAGKTTVTDLITGLQKPTKGSITIDGTNLKDLQIDTWRTKVGFVTQDVILFDDSLANNITLWSCSYDEPGMREKIHQAAKMACCHDFISELPMGYQTGVGDRGTRLSGGQRQRVAIARELFKNPELLILDEATSALDSESERSIQDSILSLKGHITVVIIAHRLSTVKHADNIIVMDKGKIIQQGPFQVLMKESDSIFARMVQLQTL